MDFKGLVYLTTIAKTGNITKAAEELFISQSALSLRLKAEEEKLGCSLFTRSTHGLTLTYEGERVNKTAEQILLKWARLEAELRDIREERGGRIRLGLSTYRSAYMLPYILTRIANYDHEIRIETKEGLSLALQEMIENRSLDLAVCPYPIEMEKLGSHLVGKEEVTICLRNDHPALQKVHRSQKGGRRWLSIEELKEYPVILLGSGQKLRTTAESLYAKAGYVPNILHETFNLQTSIELTKVTSAYSFAYSSCINNLVFKGLEYISIGEEGVYLDLAVVYRKDLYYTKTMALVAQLVTEAFHQGGGLPLE